MKKKLTPLSAYEVITAKPDVFPLHSLTPTEIEEKEWFLNLLEENRQMDVSFQNSLLQEIAHFAAFAGSMVLAFPAGMFMRNRVRTNKQLAFILQFPELLTVRSNIEKGSFAYDTLLFRQSAFQVLQNKSHLANLVCLAILFGDEFIDGLAVTAGKQTIRTILQDSSVNCNLQYRYVSECPELYYAFDIRDLLPSENLNTVNEKYGITYREFYDHLLFLLDEMNRHLKRLPAFMRTSAAQLICQVCNRCFDTYKTDIAAFRPDYHLRDLFAYLDKKDDEIIHCLLELRAVLLEKNLPVYCDQFKGWSTMVRSMQIYDDMEDAASDYSYQMNFVCYFAHRFFRKEWEWLQQEAEMLQQIPALQRHLLISLNMPGSVIACRQYARSIVVEKLSWVQKKITSYLWKKNWFGWKNQQLDHGDNLFSAISREPLSIQQKAGVLFDFTMRVKESFISEDLLYAHIADTALIDPVLKKHFLKFLPTREAYFMKHQYFDYPINRKAMYARKWLSMLHPESVT